MSGHTPGPWCSDTGAIYAACQLDERGMTRESPIAEVGDGRPENYVSNCRLIAAAPDLLEALIVVEQCGDPVKVSLYDEEGIEGWRWAHPDGREWEEIGDWSDPPPLHPLSQAAIAKATGAAP